MIAGLEEIDESINFEEYDSIPVNVSPPDRKTEVPTPVKTFEECKNFAPALQANLKKYKFERCTPIQSHSVPILMARHDIMGSAQTGSGKTLAFMVPIVARILSDTPAQRMFFPGKLAVAYPIALVLAPTRELAAQIGEATAKILENTGLRSYVIFGGDNYNEQAAKLSEAATDVLIATPGRLIDMFKYGKVSLNFVRYVAMDEV